jgi:hypothetical protein
MHDAQPAKNPKVALTACMRKLLIMFNAVGRHQTIWNPEVGKIRSNLPCPFSAARGGAVIAADVIGTA